MATFPPMNTLIPHQIAQTVLDGFAHYRHLFIKITLGARQRFENADWKGAQDAARDRIMLYETCVDDVVKRLAAEVGDTYLSHDAWRQAKTAFVLLARLRTDGELAETVFNSIYRRTFRGRPIHDDALFVHSYFERQRVYAVTNLCNVYRAKRGVVRMVNEILDDYAFDIPWENKRRDVANIVRELRRSMPKAFTGGDVRVEILRSMFYRNKGAYMVGRVIAGDQALPFVAPILNNERGGVYIDTLITHPDDVTIVFSFTRSYFMVNAPVPSEYVHFLQTMLPEKKLSEIYSSIGFFKQGKTEFYRGFVEHLRQSDDQFIIAPGTKGMVMTVFTLPSYDVVFKVIRDQFAPPKDTTRQIVEQKYHLVKVHDRVGRMADTQEFHNFSFPRERFSDELLEELVTAAPSTVEIGERDVLIKHLYTERLMTPLNLYVQKASGEELRHALDDYGWAIKQLAAANIFPGDMLLKNFGVTRHERVVFYDYDEICYLTECNFRRIPVAQRLEDEMSAEPWYSFDNNDVFPEEFAPFMFPDQQIRAIFTELHGDLFEPEFWQGLQQAIREGQIVDIFPYGAGKRFPRALPLAKSQRGHLQKVAGTA